MVYKEKRCKSREHLEIWDEWNSYLPIKPSVKNKKTLLTIKKKFLPAVNGNFSCFTSSPILGMVSYFNFNHCVRCVVVSPGGFNLHLPND